MAEAIKTAAQAAEAETRPAKDEKRAKAPKAPKAPAIPVVRSIQVDSKDGKTTVSLKSVRQGSEKSRLYYAKEFVDGSTDIVAYTAQLREKYKVA